MATPPPTGRPTARVVVLAGPSGAGKSRLAGRLHAAHGWPIVRLDDFYRDEDDPAVPRSRELGIVDWDHPDSWDRDAAVAALTTLVHTGSVRTPVYDISASRAVDTTTVRAAPDDLVLAEGIFAAEIITDLRERDLLAGAYCVHHHRTVTFVWRLLRDLSERRKPPLDAGPPWSGPDACRARRGRPPGGARGRVGPPQGPGAAPVGRASLTHRSPRHQSPPSRLPGRSRSVRVSTSPTRGKHR